MAQLAGVGGQDCDEALVESGSYQVTAHPASSLVNATTRGRHVNARAPAAAIDRISPEAWTPAYDADGVQRDGAVGGRVDRDDRHVGLARRDAGDRPEREPASGCPIAVH
jgi:hypothetical protein